MVEREEVAAGLAGLGPTRSVTMLEKTGAAAGPAAAGRSDADKPPGDRRATAPSGSTEIAFGPPQGDPDKSLAKPKA